MEPGDHETFPEPVRIPPACWRMERKILLGLLAYCDDIEEWPWRTIGEVMGSTTDPILALDALASLVDNGLVRRTGENVMASSIAYACYQLMAYW